MDFRQLKYFTTVYEAGNFTLAAGQLHISQQGLSKSIQNLEKELETPLFFREHTGIKPTQMGMIFYKQALHLNEEYQKTLQLLEDARNEHKILRVGFATSTFGALTGIDTALLRFQALHPDITLEIFNETDYVCEEKIEKGNLDVAFSMGNFSSSKIQTHLLLEEVIYAVLPDNHPLAQRKFLTIMDICKEPLLTTDKKNKGYQVLLQDFQQQQVSPHIAFCTDDIQTHFSMTKNNLGISLLPEHLLSLMNDSYHLKAVPVVDFRKRKIYVIHKKGKNTTPQIEKFLKFCQKLFQNR